MKPTEPPKPDATNRKEAIDWAVTLTGVVISGLESLPQKTSVILSTQMLSVLNSTMGRDNPGCNVDGGCKVVGASRACVGDLVKALKRQRDYLKAIGKTM